MVEDPAESGLTETCSIVKERKKRWSNNSNTKNICPFTLLF